MEPIFLEYVWIDGTEPTKKLRSKSKLVDLGHPEMVELLEEEIWNFDGSSTNQAQSHDSERFLKPVRIYNDPFRGGHNKIALCEVYMPDGETPHESNTRSNLAKTYLESGNLRPWFGFEQEYCLMKGSNILGWPDTGFPAPQGPYYCGVGFDEVVGREVAEEHAQACLKAGIMLYGINAEVMLGQWEFQVGHRGFKGDSDADPLKVSDDLWMARYLLYRVCEKHGVWATLDPKPKRGDWNGSGLHTNFSDSMLRDPKVGMSWLKELMVSFKEHHNDHIEVYGHGNENRMTGKHETSDINKFNFGTASRETSIRVPNKTSKDGCGYVEDRRPAANADPYEVANQIVLRMNDTTEMFKDV